MSAILPPRPCPVRPPWSKHFRISGTSTRPLIADHDDCPLCSAAFGRPRGVRLARSNGAGPLNFKSDIPAPFTIAPSGARLPFTPPHTAVTVIGCRPGLTTSLCGFKLHALRFRRSFGRHGQAIAVQVNHYEAAFSIRSGMHRSNMSLATSYHLASILDLGCLF